MDHLQKIRLERGDEISWRFTDAFRKTFHQKLSWEILEIFKVHFVPSLRADMQLLEDFKIITYLFLYNETTPQLSSVAPS